MRDKFHIITEGDNLPPAITDFADMRMPKSILRFLETKNIKKPTPIQMQARGFVQAGCLHLRSLTAFS